jgi:hypothetical protein
MLQMLQGPKKCCLILFLSFHFEKERQLIPPTTQKHKNSLFFTTNYFGFRENEAKRKKEIILRECTSILRAFIMKEI